MDYTIIKLACLAPLSERCSIGLHGGRNNPNEQIIKEPRASLMLTKIWVNFLMNFRHPLDILEVPEQSPSEIKCLL